MTHLYLHLLITLLTATPTHSPFYSNPNGVIAGSKVAIVWFRNDLRLHDNEALASANGSSTAVLPVYCFDPRDYGDVCKLQVGTLSTTTLILCPKAHGAIILVPYVAFAPMIWSFGCSKLQL